jgi:ABC-type lipoprotein export system ATPase subunit
VARALINNPSVLLADEPTGALDQSNSNNLIDLLNQLNTQKGVTLLMVTHSEHSANQMKHTYHLNDGNLNQQR